MAFFNSISGYFACLIAQFSNHNLRIDGDNCILPFNCDAPVRSYLYSAFPTGIIASRLPLGGPALGYYIQLFFPQSKLTPAGRNAHVCFLPGLGFHQFAALRYLNIKPWTIEEFQAMTPCQVAGTIVNKLKCGIYIHAYINEFFIPSSRFYLRRHVRHDILLVGYDKATRSFIQASYQRDGAFSLGRVPVSMLIESLRLYKYRINHPVYNDFIEEITPESRYPNHIDSDVIRDQLRTYLEARNNAFEYDTGGPYALRGFEGMVPVDRKGGYGIGVYTLFRQYFEAFVRKECTIDLRATRILMEHKKMVQHALLGASGNSLCYNFANEYCMIVTLAQRLHLTAFALLLERETSQAHLLIKLINELESAEKRVITYILKMW